MNQQHIDARRQSNFLPHFLSCQDDLRAYVTVLVRDRHAVDDIMQEVAIVLWKKFDDYDPTRPFGPWARTCTRFQVMAYLKTRKRSRLVLGDAAIHAIENAMNHMEEETSLDNAKEILNRCMATLTKRPREILRLRYGEGWGLEQICSSLEMSLAAVKKCIFRTRSALRTCCAQAQEGEAG